MICGPGVRTVRFLRGYANGTNGSKTLPTEEESRYSTSNQRPIFSSNKDSSTWERESSDSPLTRGPAPRTRGTLVDGIACVYAKGWRH